MSVRRVLVDAAVVSLQDPRVYYPCCKCCLSRIDVEQEDATRCRCFKCGYRCLKEQLDYRYRLSLKVARRARLFGVTVFGTCLNPFFGVHAGGLQRLVDNVDGSVGASTRSTYLVKAVEDCFIGRHFIFGIKVTGAEGELWSSGPVANGSSGETVQFIASQMILPKATEQSGCTVLSYYRVLLQRAEEYELRPAGTSNSPQPPAKALLLIPLRSPAFNNTTLSASGLLSQSLQRLQHQDSSINPTPPWQQSLGLVTSSAEQSEVCATQESCDENSRVTDHSKTPHHTPSRCVEDRKCTEEATPSPLLPFNSSFFSIYPDFSIEKSIVNTPTPDKCSSPFPSFKTDLPLKTFPSTQLTTTFSSTSLAWDDLPFSESLTEFLCEKDNVSQTELHRNVAETTRHNLENVSYDKKWTPQISQPRLLANIINTPGQNKRRGCPDLSDVEREKPNRRVKSSKAKSIYVRERNQRDVELSSLSFEEQLDGDAYDCSGDLFSGSCDMNATTLGARTETVSADAQGSSHKGTAHPEKENRGSDGPHTQKLETTNSDTLNPPAPHYVDFVPRSQSTPNVARLPAPRRFSPALGGFGLQLDSQDLCAYHRNLSELGCKTAAKIPSSLWKLNAVGANPLPLCSYNRKSSVCNVTTCDHGNNEVPPTPAAKTQQSLKHRRRRLRDNRISKVDSTCESQNRDGVNCKRILLRPSLTSLQRSMARTGNADNEGSSWGVDGLLLDDENQACDWSRDLFSDSS